MTGVDGMAQGATCGDRIAVAAPGPRSGDVAGLNEVGQDFLRRALGHPYLYGEVTHPDLRIPGDGKQNMGMVGEKRPPRPGGRIRGFFWVKVLNWHFKHNSPSPARLRIRCSGCFFRHHPSMLLPQCGGISRPAWPFPAPRKLRSVSFGVRAVPRADDEAAARREARSQGQW